MNFFAERMGCVMSKVLAIRLDPYTGDTRAEAFHCVPEHSKTAPVKGA
jgi:hypothetical protein